MTKNKRYPIYDPRLLCRACREQGLAKIRYCEQAVACFAADLGLPDKPHLHLTCARCGYHWVTATFLPVLVAPPEVRCHECGAVMEDGMEELDSHLYFAHGGDGTSEDANAQ